jgi:hypothetical protein
VGRPQARDVMPGQWWRLDDKVWRVGEEQGSGPMREVFLESADSFRWVRAGHIARHGKHVKQHPEAPTHA